MEKWDLSLQSGGIRAKCWGSTEVLGNMDLAGVSEAMQTG